MLTTSHVASHIQENIQSLLDALAFQKHPKTQSVIKEYTQSIIDAHFNVAVDQVENTIKPYKYEIEITATEWKDALLSTQRIIQEKLKEHQRAYHDIRQSLGKRHYKHALRQLQNIELEKKAILDGELKGELIVEEQVEPVTRAGLNVLEKVRLAKEHERRVEHYKQRLYAVGKAGSLDARQCAPEVYLVALSQKLAATAALFISIELLRDFEAKFPRDLEKCWYGRVEEVCLENGDVMRHLGIQRMLNDLSLIVKEVDVLIK
jgi:hypothetical protein